MNKRVVKAEIEKRESGNGASISRTGASPGPLVGKICHVQTNVLATYWSLIT